MRKLASAIVASSMWLAASSSASATVLDQGCFSSFEVFPETTIADLPCLEGTEFLGTGTEAIRGSFVDSAQGFHFEQNEKHTGQLVPVGDGLTYVEQGNVETIHLNGPPLGGGGAIVFTKVNIDAFAAIDEDGHVVGRRRSASTSSSASPESTPTVTASPTA